MFVSPANAAMLDKKTNAQASAKIVRATSRTPPHLVRDRKSSKSVATTRMSAFDPSGHTRAARQASWKSPNPVISQHASCSQGFPRMLSRVRGQLCSNDGDHLVVKVSDED